MAQKNRRIVITGATRGLGRALVDGMIPLGHQIYGCGTSSKLVDELKAKYPSHHFEVVDVTKSASVDAWVKKVLATGAPDVLINNAAVINVPAKLWEIAEKDFNHMMNVNIVGVANVLRGFLPAMVERKAGVIVNLSSAWGRSTSAKVAPYCASKYAMEGLTKALAQELPTGMAAIPLNPGIIDTDMLRQAFGEGAGSYPKAAVWAKSAVPFILGFSAKDNGVSHSVP